jgi:hypothetical protein
MEAASTALAKVRRRMWESLLADGIDCQIGNHFAA